MKLELKVLAITALFHVCLGFAHAEYEEWFTVVNHPDGNNHSAYVLHDGSWSPSGPGAFMDQSGVQAVYIDGFLPDQAGRSREALELTFALATAKGLSPLLPLYIIRNNTGAYPIRPDQFTRETRLDSRGNSFTSHYLKHATIAGWEWYDYNALKGFTKRKESYFAALWQLAMQPARDTGALDDMTRLAELKRTLTWAGAAWGYVGEPVLPDVVDAYFDALVNNSAINASSADQYLSDIVNSSWQAAQIKTAIADIGLFLSILSAGGELASSFQIGLLYDRLVVLPQVSERITAIEAAVAASPAYDPALNAAVEDLRNVYEELAQPADNGLTGWLGQRLIWLQHLRQTNPDQFTSLVRSGVSLAISGTTFYVTVIAGVVLSPATGLAMLGGSIAWDSLQGLQDEWDKMNIAALFLNLDEILSDKLHSDISSLSLISIDYNAAKRVCALSSVQSYGAYMFHELMADIAIDPASPIFYFLKLFVVGLTDSVNVEYRDNALIYAGRNLSANGSILMQNNRDILSIDADGSGWPLSNYSDTKSALLGKLVWERPRTGPNAAIQSISPSPITRGSGSVTFNGSTSAATTPGASLSTYRWISSLDGQLYSGSSSSFSRNSSELSAGQHTITLQVRDSNGLWSKNTAQSTLYVYEPGPDAGHDLAVWRIELDTTAIPINSSVRTDLLIRNDGSHTESNFNIRYKLLRSNGTVMDEKVKSTTVVWEPGQTDGPGYVYLSASGGYQGSATIEVVIENTLDENRSNNTMSLGIFVGSPPVYDGYFGGAWSVIHGTGDPYESGYTLTPLFDGGVYTTFRITKGSSVWEQNLNSGEMGFFDANKLAVLYSGKDTTGGKTRYMYSLFVNNATEAWLDSKLVNVTETDTAQFVLNRSRMDSTWCNNWYIGTIGDGTAVATWNQQEQKIDDYRRSISVTPPLGTARHYEFWMLNCISYNITATSTHRSGNSMALRGALTVHKDLEPNTAITAGPIGTYSSRTAVFRFTGTDDRTSVDNLSYSYRLIGHQDGWSAYSSATSITYTDLPNGEYTFEVRAKDNVGQVDPSPASRTFTVDVQHPPNTPSHINPNHGAMLAATLGIELLGSSFADPDPGASHAASEFRVRAHSGGYSSSAWSSGVVGGVTTVTVDPGSLPHPGQYWWQCRYRDNTDRWSEWSGETTFSLKANNLPVANNKNMTAVHSRNIVIPLPATDPDGDPITAEIVNGPSSGGTAEITGPLSVSYTPPLGFLGEDTFAYRVCDGLLESSVASVNISVVNHSPVANSIIVVIESGKRTTLPLPASDADGDQLSYELQQAPVEGTLFVDDLPSGRVDYQSPAGFNEEIGLTYSVNDGIASATGTVTVVVSDPANMSLDLVHTEHQTFVVKYPAIAGFTYSLQLYNDLSGEWADLFVETVGDGTVRYHEIPAGMIVANQTYTLRVRVKDNTDQWSDWLSKQTTCDPNLAPFIPELISPANGATGVSLTPMLQASAFSDPDIGDTHANSQWQVGSNNFSSPEWDSGENFIAGTSVIVSAGKLIGATTYHWRVRYKDNLGTWSDWSESREFSTQASGTVETPAFGPDGGEHVGNILEVTVSCDTDDATIHYTTDGTEPTEASASVVSGDMVSVPIPGTLKARAFKVGWNPSPTGIANFTEAPSVATPAFNPDSGAYPGSSVNVKITCTTVDATIRYTMNGSEPTEASQSVTSGGKVTVPVPGTLKAKAFKTGMNPSTTKSASYKEAETVATPAFDPDGGEHPGAILEVTITCATAGATIRYTTNGSEPTEASQSVTSGGKVNVPVPGTLKAKAWKSGLNPSSTKSASYTRDEISLADAVDEPALIWTTGGAANWFGQSSVTCDGVDAAQSGAISHNQESWMQTTVTGPGTVSFWWRVSSEANYDRLRFYIDSYEQSNISGTVNWQQKSFYVGSGNHTIKWAYTKDYSVSSGSDCGWVDQVVWTKSGTQNILPPAHVSASVGAYVSYVAVAWDASPRATHYKLYRSTSPTGARTAITGWQSTRWFQDTTAVPGWTYYYFVQAAASATGARASDYSTPVTGWRILSAPTGITASDGPYHGNVTITWKAVPRASHYAVFRIWPASGVREQISPWQTELVFRDYFALPGATYHYSVRAALNSYGYRPGLFSAVDPGWRMIPPPEGLVASRGLYSDRTVLQWPEAPGAAFYRVYRAETWNGTRTALSTWETKLWFWDTRAIPGKTYYYFIQPAAGSGGYRPGAISAPVAGWRSTGQQSQRMENSIASLSTEIDDSPGQFETWYVDTSLPEDTGDGLSWATAMRTLQAAVDAAADGDTILVAGGLYEPLDIRKKTLLIEGVDGAEATVIEGNGSGRCVTFSDASGSTAALLRGFTLRNGRAELGGGAFGGTLENCILEDNMALEGGGAYGSTLLNSVISGNFAELGGGASEATLVNCTVVDNIADVAAGVYASEVLNSIVRGNLNSLGEPDEYENEELN